MPRKPRHHVGRTDRQALRQIYEALWKGNRKRRTYTAHVIEKAREAGFTITTPEADSPIRNAIPLLRRAAATTHNPRYVEMIELLERDGLDNPRNLSRMDDDIFLSKVDRLHRDGKIVDGKRRPISVLEACECVVAEWGLGALTTTFDAEVQRLRQAWLSRRST
jgi:hypothetical protein